MPVSQVMVFSATPPTTGETPTTFNFNAISCWTDLKNNIVPNLNTAFGQMNDLETNVNAKEVSAIAASLSAITSADIAAANANFKGTWIGATSYAVPSSVYYNGEYFIALRQNSNQIPNPLAATLDWAPYSIAFQITNATDKTTPVDADVFGFLDSATSMILKKLTWANIKATMKTYTDTLYVALTGAQTVSGVKTFSSNPLSSAVQDTAITALTRKDYVDTKAPLASPTFTGTPAAPTATSGTNTTQLATTEFVELSKNILQTVYTELTTSGTGAGTIPHDSSIPQNTEGNEILTLSITPKKSSSKLLLIIQSSIGEVTNSGNYGCVALFRDSTANAIAVCPTNHDSSTTLTKSAYIMHSEPSVSTSQTTFKIRVGIDVGSVRWNGDGATQYYGVANKTSITIMEVM